MGLLLQQKSWIEQAVAATSTCGVRGHPLPVLNSKGSELGDRAPRLSQHNARAATRSNVRE